MFSVNQYKIKPSFKYVLNKNGICEAYNRKKQEKFQKWLREFSNNMQIKNIIERLICDVKSHIKNKEFSITDENELKNNIATFIYSISSCQVKK